MKRRTRPVFIRGHKENKRGSGEMDHHQGILKASESTILLREDHLPTEGRLSLTLDCFRRKKGKGKRGGGGARSPRVRKKKVREERVFAPSLDAATVIQKDGG